jgi:hypothetical protein
MLTLRQRRMLPALRTKAEQAKDALERKSAPQTGGEILAYNALEIFLSLENGEVTEQSVREALAAVNAALV